MSISTRRTTTTIAAAGKQTKTKNVLSNLAVVDERERHKNILLNLTNEARIRTRTRGFYNQQAVDRTHVPHDVLRVLSSVCKGSMDADMI